MPCRGWRTAWLVSGGVRRRWTLGRRGGTCGGGGGVRGIRVRREFFAIGELPQKEEPSRTVRLLVFGGSQGARIFNEMMPRIAKSLMEEVPGLRIVHQAGAKFAEPVEGAYGASGADATRWEVSPFLDDMPRRFA